MATETALRELAAPAGPGLFGGGEMARAMAAKDWSQTAVGPPDGWPAALRTAVDICLGSRFPICMTWGPDYTTFYNDAYLPIIGALRHPRYLGGSFKECWSEIWDVIGPMIDGVVATGQATYSEDLLLLIARSGHLEEAYFTFSYGPIRDGADVRGMFCAVSETTERVLGERRLLALRELAAATLDARDAEHACRLSCGALDARTYDVPFALVYLLDQDGRQARLVASSGIEAAHPLAPERIELAAEAGAWPLAEARSGAVEVDARALGGSLPGGPWAEPPNSALVMPVARAGHSHPAGFLVAGVSPRRALDDQYRGFFELLAGHLSTAIASAEAREQERRRAEALAELDRAKTTFFNNISHEFRTPLTLQLGPLEELLAGDSSPLPEDVRQRVEMIQRSSLRLLKLVNTLLDFARIEAGRVDASFEATDLPALTASLASEFRSAVERAGLGFEVDCLPSSEPAWVDRDMWEKIVLNLLSNALKFTFEGSVSVRLKRRRQHFELSVRDTGVGLPRAEVPHLFERFHRVAGVQARTFEGSGIGLSLVDELARLHGGEVAVSSRLGHGSTFTVRLPRGREHLPAERLGAGRGRASTATGAKPFVEEALRWLPTDTAPPPRSEQAGACVLLVDDNADMREYAASLLSPLWTVRTAADGAEALEALRRQPADLVLADVMMPRLDGFQLLQAIRADPSLRGIPVILLSARSGEEATVDGLQAGADDYLIKPFAARELVARVRTHLELGQARGRARQGLEEALRLRNVALTDLMHDLNTPLTAISGLAQLLVRQFARGAEAAQLSPLADSLLASARKLQSMVADLDRTVRLEVGDAPRLHLARCDLVSIIRGEIEEAARAGEQRQVVFEGPEELAGVWDAHALGRVFANLLSNAFKFSPVGEAVRVAVVPEGDGGSVVASVADRGIGIPAADVSRIFERFQRAGNARAKAAGKGVGLAEAFELVRQHGGAIWVDSQEGRGSTFNVRLPLEPPTGAPAS